MTIGDFVPLPLGGTPIDGAPVTMANGVENGGKTVGDFGGKSVG